MIRNVTSLFFINYSHYCDGHDKGPYYISWYYGCTYFMTNQLAVSYQSKGHTQNLVMFPDHIKLYDQTSTEYFPVLLSFLMNPSACSCVLPPCSLIASMNIS